MRLISAGSQVRVLSGPPLSGGVEGRETRVEGEEESKSAKTSNCSTGSHDIESGQVEGKKGSFGPRPISESASKERSE